MKLTVLLVSGGDCTKINIPGADVKRCRSYSDVPDFLTGSDEDWVMLMDEGDKLSDNFLADVEKCAEKYADSEIIFSARRYLPGQITAEFSRDEDIRENIHLVSSRETAWLHAWFVAGTVMKKRIMARVLESADRGQFFVMRRLIEAQEAAAASRRLVWLSDALYSTARSYAGDKTFFEGVYKCDWYEELVRTYLPDHGNEKFSKAMQYQEAFLINAAVEANLNNVNKHLYEGEEAVALLKSFGKCLRRVDMDVLLDERHFCIQGKNSYLRRWLYLILRQDDRHLEYEWMNDGGQLYFGYDGIKAGSFDKIKADIVSMDFDTKSRILTIEGRVSPLVYMHGGRFLACCHGKTYIPEKRERYALTKAFNVSIYKLQSFHLEIEIPDEKNRSIEFFMEGEWGRSIVLLEFDSHFSRLSNSFSHSYWRFGRDLTMTCNKNSLDIRKEGRMSAAGREAALWLDMLKTGKKKIIKYIPVRLFMHMKPLFKRRPIWLFIDKIYKGGDSAEYLWHYVKEHDRSVDAYYLLDKSSPDYERLAKTKDKPLARRSLAHRRAFLYADYVVISNSTVFAFNDFSTKNSAYIRDLINFKTVCVQHGMSVQKIAVAQNRLRDNISLYFCASKYEIENLMKPVYDYAGTNILRLTGVPRYDGLVNKGKKQILISPTWRMQAAVPVTKNESVMRDYNPFFSKTEYFKVYNSLINDNRLLDAAGQFGYKIIYVLHPIVSAQINDFTRNECVSIVQGGGDVNYEELLCESGIMVTDYSGVQFDFAYMRKPVVYLHHKDIPKHYEEGTFVYSRMAFGEICDNNSDLIDVLISYMKNGCEMKPEYRRRVDDFFAYNDRNNCERIYNVMKECSNIQKGLH